MAGVVRSLRDRLQEPARGLSIDDLLMEDEDQDMEPTGFEPEYEEDPLFDGIDDEMGDTFDLNMTESPDTAGGEEDIDALREALIERARDRHMATDEFQHAIARGNLGGRR